jgi:uncharacterized protein DUF5658
VKIELAVPFITIVALSLPSFAAAAEKDDSKPSDVIESFALTAPMSDDVPVKRPASLPALYMTFAAMQAWDLYSTSAALKVGSRENNPLAAPFAGNPGSMIALKAMSTASTIFFAERLWKNHRVAAVVVMTAINGATAAVALHNMRTARAAIARR